MYKYIHSTYNFDQFIALWYVEVLLVMICFFVNKMYIFIGLNGDYTLVKYYNKAHMQHKSYSP